MVKRLGLGWQYYDVTYGMLRPVIKSIRCWKRHENAIALGRADHKHIAVGVDKTVIIINTLTRKDSHIAAMRAISSP